MVKLVKYFEVVGVLVAGFLLTGRFLLTPELLVALLIFNDFVTLSISTDEVTVSPVLDVWHVGKMIRAAIPLALSTAIAVGAVATYATIQWHLTIAQIQGVVFLAVVVMGQIAVYVLRDRRSVFGPTPSKPLLTASAFAVVAASLMSVFGIAAARLPPSLAGSIVGLLFVAGAVIMLAKGAVLAVNRRTAHAG
jgi:hypothetical protein